MDDQTARTEVLDSFLELIATEAELLRVHERDQAVAPEDLQGPLQVVQKGEVGEFVFQVSAGPS